MFDVIDNSTNKFNVGTDGTNSGTNGTMRNDNRNDTEQYGTITGTIKYYIEMVYILSEHSLKENESPNENYNGN